MKHIVTALCLAALVLTAGCIGGDPPPETEIAYTGSFNVSSESFRMSGDVTQNGYHPEEPNYQDIVVCMYSTQGDLLYKTPPKPMNETGHTPISVTLDSVPQYVVINSSDFWSSDRIRRVAYYRKSTDDDEVVYEETWATQPGDLPEQNC